MEDCARFYSHKRGKSIEFLDVSRQVCFQLGLCYEHYGFNDVSDPFCFMVDSREVDRYKQIYLQTHPNHDFRWVVQFKQIVGFEIKLLRL